jgi:hypothetical protein
MAPSSGWVNVCVWVLDDIFGGSRRVLELERQKNTKHRQREGGLFT